MSGLAERVEGALVTGAVVTIERIDEVCSLVHKCRSTSRFIRIRIARWNRQGLERTVRDSSGDPFSVRSITFALIETRLWVRLEAQ